MCGIAGYIGRGERTTLRNMCESLKHRGPDDSGLWQGGEAHLAFARLAIIDTSPAGHQPMVDDTGNTAIIFNGEIYNFKKLRVELAGQGVIFKSHSDTEVILKLYERDGVKCFEKLEGMFAIALFDTLAKTLILARDRMGEKPLYYTQAPGAFVFGSELKAVLAHEDVSRALDARSLAQYLANEFVSTPRTIYEGICKLEPGHLLTRKEGQIVITPFWNPVQSQEPMDEAAAIARLDELLSGSVERQLIADVPLGVFLSGGIDSSTVAYYAQKKVGSSLNTFSIGFSEQEFDESNDARLVAKHLGTSHHEEILSAADALALVSEIPEVFDEPVADASVLPTMLLSRFARKHVTVALGGDGADELLLGYQTFKAEQYAKAWGRMPAALRAAGTSLARALPTSHGYFSLDFKARSFTEGYHPDPFIRHLNWRGSFRADELQELLTPRMRPAARDEADDLVEQVRAECPELTGENALSHLYLRTYLLDDILPKVDRASMHYSLEVRAPFLDQSLVSFLLALPASMKFRNGKGKWLLRELMKDKLPPAILNKKKRGFAPPVAEWLAGPLKPLLADMLSPARIKEAGIFEPVAIERLLAEHFDGTRDNRKKLWTLLTFELWRDRWLNQS